MRSVVLVCIAYLILGSCKAKRRELMNDAEKDALKGNVESVCLYAYRWFETISVDSTTTDSDGKKKITEKMAIDTERVLLSTTKYTKSGFYSEIQKHRNDTLLSRWSYRQSKDTLHAHLSRLKQVDPDLFLHKKYFYNTDNVSIVIFYNAKGDGVLREKITCRRKYIIDSTFYFNGGLKESSRVFLTCYGLDIPEWVRPDSGIQYDSNHNLLIDNNVHYYYEEYDKAGNWVRAVKYYNGPERDKPVYLKREITYYKD